MTLVDVVETTTAMTWPTNRTEKQSGWRTNAVRQQTVRAILVAAALTTGAFAVHAQSNKPPAAAAAAGAGEGGLAGRVQTLEEQLIDMQVVVGTLESLAKSGGAPAPAFNGATTGGGGGADASRIAELETQIRQLSIQVQALSDQLRGGGAGPPQRRGDTGSIEPGGGMADGGFGATTVTPGEDPIGGLISQDPPRAPAGQPSGFGDQAPTGGAGGSMDTAALPPAGDSANPKQLYETAYGYLLQRDYGAAQAAFEDFLKKHPSDSLSGNAQYWLGESYFVRGQYKAAAGAFLKGYQSYAQSPKAADSLLKLAMSLDRLGQKDAACSSYAELGVKFPNAAQSVKSRAQSERQRVGCS